MDDGKVNIHGKTYLTVAYRVNALRESHPDYGISTDLVDSGDNVIIKAIIRDHEGFVLSTGYAEEVRGSTNINKTSALENCETSAIGRALASLGLGGTEYASADEVANAINQQGEKALYEGFTAHMRATMDCISSIMTVKQGIADKELSAAIEAWDELSDDEKTVLWRATTKGGCFTTEERKVMKSDDWAAVRKENG